MHNENETKLFPVYQKEDHDKRYDEAVKRFAKARAIMVKSDEIYNNIKITEPKFNEKTQKEVDRLLNEELKQSRGKHLG